MPAFPVCNPRTLFLSPLNSGSGLKKKKGLVSGRGRSLWVGNIERGETAEERQKANASARGVAWEFPKMLQAVTELSLCLELAPQLLF